MRRIISTIAGAGRAICWMRARRAFSIDSFQLGLPSSYAACFESGERRLGALGDGPCLMLGESRHDMYGEAIGLGHVGSDEIDTGLHQPGNEVHVARQAIQFGDKQSSCPLFRLFNGSEQLWPIAGAALFCVSTSVNSASTGVFLATRFTASRCASKPSPLSPCLSVETR